MDMMNLFCCTCLTVKANTIVASKYLLTQIFPRVREQIGLILIIFSFFKYCESFTYFFLFVCNYCRTFFKKLAIKFASNFNRVRVISKLLRSVGITTMRALIKNSCLLDSVMLNNNNMVWSVANTVFNFRRCQRKTVYTFINLMKFINVNAFKSTGITSLASRHTIGYNGSQLPEGGDFGTQNCQYTMNLNRSTKPHNTTKPPLLGRCCYRFVLLCKTNKF